MMLRCTRLLYRLMRICHPWNDVCEWRGLGCDVHPDERPPSTVLDHPVWYDGIRALDPNDCLKRYNTASDAASGEHVPMPFFHRFRMTVACSCNVCRMNYPRMNHGLDMYKRTAHVPFLMGIGLCKDHKRGTFCCICLVAQPWDPAAQPNPYIAENEDTECFPQTEYTCKHCRMDALGRAGHHDPRLRPAIDHPRYDPRDWEVRHLLDSYLEMGEGSIRDLTVTALEKQWLRSYTKNAEYSQQAMLAGRLQAREDAPTDYDSEDEFLSEEEEDPEVMAMTEEQCEVRKIALLDWSRTRILDGYWYNPSDLWWLKAPATVPAVHPLPWLASDAGDHPSEATVRTELCPTKQIAGQAGEAFYASMKNVLKPAMENIVRRIIIECAADGADPALRASRMKFAEVTEQLREPGVWQNGYDWLAQRGRERIRLRQERASGSSEDEEPLSSPTSSNHGSDATSPVLSTTTLRTTPSPEPSASIQPVLAEPVAVRAIPYIPQSLDHLPPYSRAPIEQAYRDACADLYKACRCAMCERGEKAAAAVRAAAEAALAPPPLPPMPVHPPVNVPIPPVIRINNGTPTIDLTTPLGRDADADSNAEEISYTDVEDPEVAIIDVAQDSDVAEPSPKSRKRQLDTEDGAPPTQRAGSPPKRIKTQLEPEEPLPVEHPALAPESLPSAQMPPRFRKRGSGDDNEQALPASTAAELPRAQHKRQRTASEDVDVDVSLYPPPLPP
jgi:hypothetical protein